MGAVAPGGGVGRARMVKRERERAVNSWRRWESWGPIGREGEGMRAI